MLHVIDDLHARDIPDLPSLLPWDRPIDDGVILTRRPGFMASYLVVGPDHLSTAPEDFEPISEQCNDFLMSLSEQRTWAIHSNIIRVPSPGYPTNNHFSSKVLQLIDRQRQLLFEEEGQHSSNRNIITLKYFPFAYISDAKVDDFFFQGDERFAAKALQRFYDGIAAFEDLFSSFSNVRRLGVKPFGGFSLGPQRITYNIDEQYGFLNYCLNGIDQPVAVSPTAMDISDYLMGEPHIVTDDGLLVGDRYASIISVRGFPPGTVSAFFSRFASTAPNMRLSNKAILLDKETSLRIAQEKKAGHFGNLFDVKDIVKSSVTREEPEGKADVRELTDDADDWISLIQTNKIRLAIANSAIVLFNRDPKQLRTDARMLVEDLRSELGMIGYIEPPDVDATKRLVGSIPGNLFAGVGLPAITTMNVADMLPIAAQWPGIEKHPSPNYPPNSEPLLIGKSTGNTSFALCLHPNGENSTTVVDGPPRGGKTTLLNTLLGSHDRYEDSIGTVMDYGGGFEVLGLALEDEGLGRYMTLAPGGTIALGPLCRIHLSPAEFMYGISFIRILVTCAGKTYTKQMNDRVTAAMTVLRDSETGDRSLMQFFAQVQDADVKSVLEDYLGKSPMASLFGATSEDFDDRPYLFFEMKQIDELADPRFVVPVYYHVLHVILRRAVDKKPYLAIFDEIWRAFVNVNPTVRNLLLDFLIGVVRTMEKMNGTPVLCIHAPEDLDTKDSKDDAKLQTFNALLKRAIVNWIHLPIPRHVTDENLQGYADLGLSKRERTLLRQNMQRARDYYYVSPEGRRPFELELSDLAKAFFISESRDDARRLLVRKLAEHQGWVKRYLEESDLGDYGEIYSTMRPGPTRRAG